VIGLLGDANESLHLPITDFAKTTGRVCYCLKGADAGIERDDPRRFRWRARPLLDLRKALDLGRCWTKCDAVEIFCVWLRSNRTKTEI
jgi:hypothetical protein